MASSIRPSTIIAATVGTAAAAFVGYAIYFDHRRRTDPGFRKALKKESKREARIARTQQLEQGQQQRAQIKAMLDEAAEEGFPTEDSDKEGYFMEHVAMGERLQSEGEQTSSRSFDYKAPRACARISGQHFVHLRQPHTLSQ